MAARKRNRIVWIEAQLLRIHPTAQRMLVPAQIRKRMADLDLDAIGILKGVLIEKTITYVDPLDGNTYTLQAGDVYIIDGQHRQRALLGHGFGEWKVAVELYPEAANPDRASALFLRWNATAVVLPFARFENAVRSGDPAAASVKRIIESHGLKIRRNAVDGDFRAVEAAMRCYDPADDGAVLNETFAVAIEAFGATTSAVEGKLIEGLFSVLQTHNGALDRGALVKKLAKYPGGAARIIGDARGLYSIRRGSTVARCVSEVVILAYNSGRHASGRLPTP